MRLPFTVRIRAICTTLLVLLACLLGVTIGADEGASRTTPASASTTQRARVELHTSAVELPLTIEEGQLVIEARLLGEGPFRFWLDTGAGGQGVLSSKLRSKLSLEKVGTQKLHDPTRQNAREGDILAVPELSLGAAVFRDLRMVALPASDKLPWERKGLDGILGFDLFANVLLTLDYAGKKLRIEQGELPADAPDVLPFTEPDGVPRIRVRLGEIELEADIDSGSMGSIGMSTDLAAEVPWATEPSVVGRIRTAFNEAEIRAGRSKASLWIGSTELPLPEVQVSPLFTSRHANLGSRILRRFTLTFDSAHGRVRFAGPAEGSTSVAAGASTPHKRYGMMLRTGNDGIPTVDKVEPGSVAETGGLKAGDRIVAVGGKAVGEIPEQDRMEAFDASPLRLGIERSGNRVELELKLD